MLMGRIGLFHRLHRRLEEYMDRNQLKVECVAQSVSWRRKSQSLRNVTLTNHASLDSILV